MAGKSPKEKFIDCVWERMEDYDEEEQVARATCSYLTSSTAPPLPPLSSPSPSTSSSSSSSPSGLGPDAIRTSPAPVPTADAGHDDDDDDSGYE